MDTDEMVALRFEHSKNMAMVQESRDNLEDEYEDLYDSHQLLSINLQEAEKRQDSDAKVIHLKNKRCTELELENSKHTLRIEALETLLTADGDGDSVQVTDRMRRTAGASVLWWKERCRTMRAENRTLEDRLALLADEACPMMCERPFSLRMQCCGSKICKVCLDRWTLEKQPTSTCPYCRAEPSVAVSVDRIAVRPGTVSQPIVIS